jgi:hypothetical protein
MTEIERSSRVLEAPPGHESRTCDNDSRSRYDASVHRCIVLGSVELFFASVNVLAKA